MLLKSILNRVSGFVYDSDRLVEKLARLRWFITNGPKVRVTGSARAITCLIKGPTIALVSLHVQHDKAYRK